MATGTRPPTRAIKRWWGQWPSANVGVPTSEQSGVVVLDVDPHAGGSESLAKLERVGGPVPTTARARTEGGYVVVPPSRTQGAYVWVDRSPLAEASWLIERLGEEDEATLF